MQASSEPNRCLRPYFPVRKTNRGSFIPQSPYENLTNTRVESPLNATKLCYPRRRAISRSKFIPSQIFHATSKPRISKATFPEFLTARAGSLPPKRYRPGIAQTRTAQRIQLSRISNGKISSLQPRRQFLRSFLSKVRAKIRVSKSTQTHRQTEKRSDISFCRLFLGASAHARAPSRAGARGGGGERRWPLASSTPE